jgi:hypothetical protein
VDTAELGLMLAAFSALDIFIGPIAALVVIAFAAGVRVGERRKRSVNAHRRGKVRVNCANHHELADEGVGGGPRRTRARIEITSTAESHRAAQQGRWAPSFPTRGAEPRGRASRGEDVPGIHGCGPSLPADSVVADK